MRREAVLSGDTSIRDGYAVGEERTDGTVVGDKQNVAETEAAVFARMGMAERMIEDAYGRDLLADDFLRSEYTLYRAAQETDLLDVVAQYARVGYGAAEDDFFARVSSEGMYQNDLSMREFLTVALLDGPGQDEVDEYNEAHRRELYEQHVEEYGGYAMEYGAFERALIDEDEDILERYRYQPQRKIDVWSYGCALNTFTDDLMSFEHVDRIYNPGYTDFSAAPGSYLEHLGRTRRAFDEIQRMDLIQVHRREPDEPFWSRLGIDTWW